MAFKMKGFPFSGSALKQDDSKKLVKGSTMGTTPSQRQKTQNLKKNIPGVNISEDKKVTHGGHGAQITIGDRIIIVPKHLVVDGYVKAGEYKTVGTGSKVKLERK